MHPFCRIAGPKFLSVGLISISSFCFNDFRMLSWGRVRLQRVDLLCLLISSLCADLSFFSKSVILASIDMEAGGGFQFLFFR